MGAIQQNINSLITTAGVMAGLYASSPAGKTRLQNIALKGQEKGLTKQMSTLMTSPEYQDPDKTEAVEQLKGKITGKLQENREEQFYNNPTDKTLKKYIGSVAQQTDERLIEENMLKAAQKEALENRLKFLRERVGNKNLSPEEQSKALQQLIEERKKGGIK